MRTKDFLMLEAAYQAVLEAKEPPCPCTVGKECKKTKCPCTKCKKDKNKMMKEMSDEDMTDGMLYSPDTEDNDAEYEELISRIRAVLMAHRDDPEANTPSSVVDDIKEILMGGGHQDQRHYTNLDQ
jgi:hypothetical protein